MRTLNGVRDIILSRQSLRNHIGNKSHVWMMLTCFCTAAALMFLPTSTEGVSSERGIPTDWENGFAFFIVKERPYVDSGPEVLAVYKIHFDGNALWSVSAKARGMDGADCKISSPTLSIPSMITVRDREYDAEMTIDSINDCYYLDFKHSKAVLRGRRLEGFRAGIDADERADFLSAISRSASEYPIRPILMCEEALPPERGAFNTVQRRNRTTEYDLHSPLYPDKLVIFCPSRKGLMRYCRDHGLEMRIIHLYAPIETARRDPTRFVKRYLVSEEEN